MRRPIQRFALSALLAGLLLPMARRIEAQSTPKVFFACYVPRTGTVYRIKEPGLPGQCFATSHVEFSWTDGAGAVRTGDAAGGDLAASYPNPRVAGLQGRPVSTAGPKSGEVLTWLPTGSDADSAWMPKTFPAGVTDHGELGGLLDDDHPQYLLANGARSVTQGFAATGGYPTFLFAGVPASGAGTRLMWAAGKAALRAGNLDADHATSWDDASVGVGSTAFGFNSTASAAFTFACCVGAIASNQFAAVLGSGSTASGWASTAIGNNATASGDYSTAIGFQANTNGMPGSTVIADAQGGAPVHATASNSFVVRAQRVWFGASGDQVANPDRYLETSTGAYLSTGGAWTSASSRVLKDAFRSEDGEAVLKRLAHVPVQSWHYRVEAPAVRHLGPTAEDFRAAFGLGDGDQAIATVDIDGVNMLAAQALERRTRALRDELGERGREIARLRAQLMELTRRLQWLESAEK